MKLIERKLVGIKEWVVKGIRNVNRWCVLEGFVEEVA